MSALKAALKAMFVALQQVVPILHNGLQTRKKETYTVEEVISTLNLVLRNF